MTAVASAREAGSALFGGRREIGPVGTVSRVAVGLVAVGLPIVLAGFGWWDALGAFVVLPAVTTVAVQLLTTAGRAGGREKIVLGAVCSSRICLLIALAVAASLAFSILTPADGEVFFWVWLGASMLVAAACGYRGCEVLAGPNLLTGRRDEIGCMIFTPIDRAEARRRGMRPASGARMSRCDARHGELRGPGPSAR